MNKPQNQNIFLTFSVSQNGPVNPFCSPKRQISLPFHWYLNFWNPNPFIYLKTYKGTSPFESCSQICGIFWVCCHIVPVYINLHCLKELIGCVTKIFIKIQRVGAATKLRETWNNHSLKMSKEGINSTANTKEGMDGQMWRSCWKGRLKRIAMWFLKTHRPKRFLKFIFCCLLRHLK